MLSNRNPKNHRPKSCVTSGKKPATLWTLPIAGCFFSSSSVGLELGFSLLLMARIHALNFNERPFGVREILVAIMYSFGFVLVVIGRSELFTEQTSRAVLPILNGQASIATILRLWQIAVAPPERRMIFAF